MPRLRPDEWNWDPCWSLPGDSIAAKLWRLMHANRLAPRALTRILTGTSTLQATGGAFHRRPLGEVKALCHVMKMSSEDYDDAILGRALAALGETTFQSARLRYCSVCLTFGYHSAYFQIAALRQCPIHQSDLLDCCSKCGALTASYGMCLDLLSRPYGCGHCGDWLSTRNPRISDFFTPAKELQSLATTWEPLERWIEDILDLPVRYASLREWVLQDIAFQPDRCMDSLHMIGTLCPLPKSHYVWTDPIIKRKALPLLGAGMSERSRWFEDHEVAKRYKQARATIERLYVQQPTDIIATTCAKFNWQALAADGPGDLTSSAKAYVLWRMHFENFASPDLLNNALDKGGVYLDDDTLPCPIWSLSREGWTLLFLSAYESLHIDVMRAGDGGGVIADVLKHSPTRHSCVLPGIDIRGREAGHFIYCVPRRQDASHRASPPDASDSTVSC